MKPIVYVEGNRYGKGVVTVCLMKKYNTFARGISICSKLDQPNDNKGINKAKGRAHKALKRKESDLPINRDEAIRLLFETGTQPFKFKSEYNTALTPYEASMVG